MPEDLPLEPDLIEVLAADTRREILGLLQDRRMTVTELSRELDLGKATIHEHLDKLTDAGLVQRDEDDRLWVYYELTGRGKRLLNPQRTRFYLALASAAVAAIVAGLAVFAFLQVGGFAADGDAGPTVVLADQTAYADEPVRLDARVNGSGVEAYLVDQEAAERLRAGQLGVEGVPLRAQPADGSSTEIAASDNRTVLASPARLDPGTYYLYVRTPEGDNAPSMPSVRLVGLDARLDRSTWYRGLDEGPLEVDVTQDGDPVDGTLRLGGGARSEGAITTPIRDGRARVGADLLDAQSTGSYRVSVQPAETSRWIDLETVLTVRDPSVALVPLHVPEDRTTSLTLHVAGPERLQDPRPRVVGSPASVTSVPQGWQLDVSPAQPGTLSVHHARRAPASVQVHPSLSLQATVHDGERVDWTVRTLGGAPVEDAAVYLDGRSRGFTNASGGLETPLPAEGEHTLGVHRPHGEVVRWGFTVDGWELEEIEPSLTVDPVNVVDAPHDARITVEVHNPDPIARPATVTADTADGTVASRAVTVPANGTAQATLSVPVDEGRQEVVLEARALDTGPFRVENASADAGGEVAADAGSLDASETTGTTVQVGSELFRAAPEAGDTAARSPFEPIHDAQGEHAQAPMEVAAVLGALALAAAIGAAARRKP